jgi:hypothetical protein
MGFVATGGATPKGLKLYRVIWILLIAMIAVAVALLRPKRVYPR